MNRRIKHGMNSTYVNYDCRCPACRSAHAKAQRTWKKTAKEKAS